MTDTNKTATTPTAINAGVRINTKPFTISWPRVFKPTAVVEGADPKYSFEMIFNSEKDLDNVKEAIAQIAKANDLNLKDLRLPYHDANLSRDGQEAKATRGDHYIDKFVMKASTKRPFPVAQYNVQTESNDPLLEAQEMELYSGCVCDAILSVKYYRTAGNQGITCYIQALRKLTEGERISFDPSTLFDMDQAKAAVASPLTVPAVKTKPDVDLFL